MYYYSSNIPFQVQPIWCDTTYMPIAFGYYPPESSIQVNAFFPKNQIQNQQSIQVKVETSESLDAKKESFDRQNANQPILEHSSKNFSDATHQKKKQKKRYKRKNNETNIINQIFSYLCYQKKSQKICSRVLDGNNQKIQTFYAYMKSLKKYRAKYLNVNYLKLLVTLPEKSPEWRVIQRSKKRQQILSIQQLKITIFKLAFYFLRNQCHVYLILSKRLNDISVQSHLQKRRQILQIITQHFSKMLKGGDLVKLQQNQCQFQQQEWDE